MANCKRVPAAHAPAHGPDAVALHILAALQIIEAGNQIAHALVLGQAAHQFVSGIGVVGDLAAIEIDGQRHVAFRRVGRRPPA